MRILPAPVSGEASIPTERFALAAAKCVEALLPLHRVISPRIIARRSLFGKPHMLALVTNR
jgi:hypothetical protein